MLNLFVRKKIAARLRAHDGTDQGFTFLKEGNYVAKACPDGYVEIREPSGGVLYMMAFIFNEKLNAGDIRLLNE
jgi:hypothetical protein